MKQHRDPRILILLLVAVIALGSELGGTDDHDATPPPAYLTWQNGALSLTMLKHEAIAAAPPATAPLFFAKIPVNRADAPLLTTIPGIGPVLARRIVTARETNGMFREPESLLAVPGIGMKRLRQFTGYLRFD